MAIIIKNIYTIIIPKKIIYSAYELKPDSEINIPIGIVLNKNIA